MKFSRCNVCGGRPDGCMYCRDRRRDGVVAAIAIAVAALVAGCEKESGQQGYDACVQREVFVACVQATRQRHYRTVQECGAQARDIAWRRDWHEIPRGCR